MNKNCISCARRHNMVLCDRCCCASKRLTKMCSRHCAQKMNSLYGSGCRDCYTEYQSTHKSESHQEEDQNMIEKHPFRKNIQQPNENCYHEIRSKYQCDCACARCCQRHNCAHERRPLSPSKHLIRIETYHYIPSQIEACSCHECVRYTTCDCQAHAHRRTVHARGVEHDFRQDGVTKKQTLTRKLSDDSGRVTWSESGESSVSIENSALKRESNFITKNNNNWPPSHVMSVPTSVTHIPLHVKHGPTQATNIEPSTTNQSQLTTCRSSVKLKPRRQRRNTTTTFENIEETSQLFSTEASVSTTSVLKTTVNLGELVESIPVINKNTQVKLCGEIPKAPNETINVYGITGSRKIDEIIVTDADKVKIKIYGHDGELRHSHGTPTWPRYGRGVAMCQQGNGNFAVCHLTEVCVYTESGKPIQRFRHERFTCCWGVACDKNGNYAVTDSRSSCVYILNKNGEITGQIGGKTEEENLRTKEKRFSRKKTLSFNNMRRLRKNQSADRSLKTYSHVSRRFSIQPAVAEVNKMTKAIALDTHKEKARIIAPRYVVFNSQGQILVTDTAQRCLIVFEPDGSVAFTIGGGLLGCNACGNRNYRILESVKSDSPDIYYTYESASDGTKSDFLPSLSPPRRTYSMRSKSANTSESAEDFWEEDGTILEEEVDSSITTPRRVSIKSNTFSNILKNFKSKKKSRTSSNSESMDVGTMVGQRLHTHSDVGLCASSIAESPKQDEKFAGIYKHNHKTKMTASHSMATLWRRQQKLRHKISPVERARSTEVMAELSSDSPIRDSKSNPSVASTDDDTFLPTNSFKQQSDDVFMNESSLSVNTPLSRRHARPRMRNMLSISQPDILDYDYRHHTTSGSSSISSISDKPSRLRSNSDELDDYSIITLLRDESEAGSTEFVGEENAEHTERSACRKCHVSDPRGVAVDGNDNILLADSSKHRITLFNKNGHFIRHLLTEDDGINQPKAICLLKGNKLAVTDTSKRIKIYDLINNSNSEP